MRLPATLLLDAQGLLQGWDRAAAAWLEERFPSSADFVGRPLGALIPELDPQNWSPRILTGDGRAACTVALAAGEGGANPARLAVRFQALATASGPVIVATFQLAPAAQDFPRDAVTDLPDRRELAARVDPLRLDGGAIAPGAAILFLDLDGFKAVNDQQGHQAGDRALAVLARRWQRCVRDSDLVVRYGGDEFVVLLLDAHGDETIAPVVARLRQVANEPMPLDSAPAHLSVTIGVARADGVMTLDELVAAADRDMYARKRSSPHADAP